MITKEAVGVFRKAMEQTVNKKSLLGSLAVGGLNLIRPWKMNPQMSAMTRIGLDMKKVLLGKQRATSPERFHKLVDLGINVGTKMVPTGGITGVKKIDRILAKKGYGAAHTAAVSNDLQGTVNKIPEIVRKLIKMKVAK